MKKFLYSLVVLCLAASESAFAHKEWVHQYMVQQAYLFLENQIGQVPVLQRAAAVGYHGAGDGYVYQNILERQISIGAWQEDLDDWVYGYNFSNGYTPSITHFWKADDGDNIGGIHLYNAAGVETEYPNAWKKANIYLFCQDIDGTPHSVTVPFDIYGSKRRYVIAYNSLPELYKGNYILVGTSNTDGTNYTSAGNQVRHDPIFGQPVALNILGRVSHLLGDMSVPAHAHSHLHPCPLSRPDYYENNMGGVWFTHNGVGECESDPGGTYPAQQGWSASTAAQTGGMIKEIYCEGSAMNSMRYLFYTLNQLTDFFPSGVTSAQKNDPDGPGADTNYLVVGNASLPNGYNAYVQTRYQALGGVPPTDIVQQDIANETFNYSIRAVATLYQWFAFNAGIIQTLDNDAIVGPDVICPSGSSAQYSLRKFVLFSPSPTWSVQPASAATGANERRGTYRVTPTADNSGTAVTLTASYPAVYGPNNCFSYTATLTRQIWKGLPIPVMITVDPNVAYEVDYGQYFEIESKSPYQPFDGTTSYSWSATNGATVNSTSHSAMIGAPYDYSIPFTVTLTAMNPCGSSTTSRSFSTRADNGTIKANPSAKAARQTAYTDASPSYLPEFDVMPNPTNGEFDVYYVQQERTPNSLTAPAFALFDILGRQVLAGNLLQATTHIVTSHLSAGIYLLRVVDNGTVRLKRIQLNP